MINTKKIYLQKCTHNYTPWKSVSAGWLIPAFCDIFNTNSPSTFNIGTFSILGSWCHIAAVRDSSIGRVYAFYNGIYLGSSNDTNNTGVGVGGIGRNAFDATLGMKGYMNDVRIYKGLAKYKEGVNFTPPNQIYLT